MKLTKEQATDLAYGKPVEIAGGYAEGYTLRFRTTPDDHTNLNDYDCYGKVTPRHQYDDPRPDGFDGMAEVLHTRSTAWWWQPPADIRDQWYTNPETRQALRRTVRDILDYGFMIYTVTATRDCDACGHPDEIGRASLGGIEPLLDYDDMTVIVRDMVLDLVDNSESVPA